ncbi:hypothetical protein [Empedobacter sp. 189-2]|uniref:hypothetical protein n=1 Tax=Empedobacter sp. 189-2 TaxID=2746724 RepID=UPI002574F387|nr:hypothetical protein [Empedobacter sp. 189-2]MDM1542366.1 hypothetical protein [Empedobacter sp. 189-2]
MTLLELKDYINQRIYENNERRITGTVMNEILKRIIDVSIQEINEQIIENNTTFQLQPINPNSPAPTVDKGIWIVTQAGKYINFGGVTLPANSFGFIIKNGSNYTIEIVNIEDGLKAPTEYNHTMNNSLVLWNDDQNKTFKLPVAEIYDTVTIYSDDDEFQQLYDDGLSDRFYYNPQTKTLRIGLQDGDGFDDFSFLTSLKDLKDVQATSIPRNHFLIGAGKDMAEFRKIEIKDLSNGLIDIEIDTDGNTKNTADVVPVWSHNKINWTTAKTISNDKITNTLALRTLRGTLRTAKATDQFDALPLGQENYKVFKTIKEARSFMLTSDFAEFGDLVFIQDLKSLYYINETKTELIEVLNTSTQITEERVLQLIQEHSQLMVTIEGRKYVYSQSPANLDAGKTDIQVGDLALNVWLSETEICSVVKYVGGDSTKIINWLPVGIGTIIE